MLSVAVTCKLCRVRVNTFHAKARSALVADGDVISLVSSPVQFHAVHLSQPSMNMCMHDTTRKVA